MSNSIHTRAVCICIPWWVHPSDQLSVLVVVVVLHHLRPPRHGSKSGCLRWIRDHRLHRKASKPATRFICRGRRRRAATAKLRVVGKKRPGERRRRRRRRRRGGGQWEGNAAPFPLTAARGGRRKTRGRSAARDTGGSKGSLPPVAFGRAALRRQ